MLNTRRISPNIAVILITVGLLAVSLMAGCSGYQFSSKAKLTLPEDMNTLAIRKVESPTLEPWVPAALSGYFRDEISSRGRLRWIPSEHADGLVDLKISRMNVSSDLRNSEDVTIKYAATVVLSATIKRRLDMQRVWNSGDVHYTESFFTGNQREAEEQALQRAVQMLADRLEGRF